MGFKSVSEEITIVNAANTKAELQSKSNKVISQLDLFLLEDFSLAIKQEYRLEIMSNRDGRAATYRLTDALIDIDALVSNMVLPLKLDVEKDGNTKILDFNISKAEPNTSSRMENPKYYIYCDNSNEIGFTFWFKKNK
ncbi:hypothetical protein [Paenibacillus crassostreae]|uniref:Uncharacterized protein n=1 Tax=Paenibacillus crassostreae TaxID=1763538 RepID=A0A167EJ14_9BACL|nr:hypothetical protein [Paenibacillus crassostreae]AOZ94908.1 hypothetical protein LPB68_21855 [Paenibacillus crassostreae]OAB75590.1 hypothetical protein PNBC_08145 [Paenibacillus crassostreae]